MPVLVGTHVAPPVTPPDRPRPPDPGRPHAVWIAPDGTQVPLTSDRERHFTLDQVTGWGAAPISIVADPHPRGGTRVRHIQPQPRTITWPLRVRASTHMELVEGWRAIVKAFTMTRRLGPGRLRITRPDGSAREILAYYEAGFAGEPGQGHLWDTAVLSLYCPDPYWRDVQPHTIVREHTVGTPYLAPYRTVSSGRTLGATTIVNAGEVEAWPEWTIRGPIAQLTATNHTTGEAFVLTYSLAAGEQITITTDPPSVRGPAGQVLTSALDWPGAVLWGLDPGGNDVEFAATGSGAGTRIELAYMPRFESA